MARRTANRKRTELSVVYEDNWIVVVEKPDGMPTISTGKENETTAYSILSDHFRVFIVHRLDRDTSGLLVFAKDEDTKLALQENWSEAVLERKYTALLEGRIEDQEGWIETWLWENTKSMKVHCRAIDPRDIEDARNGTSGWAEKNGLKYASSHCRCTGNLSIEGRPYTLVEFELETGRKNQLRVHADWIGHPIAGDRKYGAQTNPLGRLALHCSTLSFIHPWTGKTLRFTSAHGWSQVRRELSSPMKNSRKSTEA